MADHLAKRVAGFGTSVFTEMSWLAGDPVVRAIQRGEADAGYE